MRKCLLLLGFLVVSAGSFAQHQRAGQAGNSPTHDYYIYISGINSRENVVQLETSIGQRPGVVSFLSHSYPVKYFILKSNNNISAEEFATWIDQNSYKLTSFGEGAPGQEKAVLAFKKSKKIQ